VETQVVQESRPDEVEHEDPSCQLAKLTGRPFPAIVLPSTSGQPVNLAAADRAVLYFYPGSQCSPEDGYDSPALDEAQHRAFAQCWTDFLALRSEIFGISSQPLDEQSVVASALGIGQPLLCDNERRVAHEIGLPTFTVDHIDWYCRATLVVNEGVIVQAFYPLASAVRSPAQAVAWMRRQTWN
jgi:peroxiredoxin